MSRERLYEKRRRERPAPPPPGTLRRCSPCGRTLPLTAEFFPRCALWKYGFSYKCKDCGAAGSRAWHRRNRQSAIRRSRRYWRSNKAAILAKMRAYYQENRARIINRVLARQNSNHDEIRAYKRRHYKRNKDKYVAMGNRRRALLKSLPGKFGAADIRRMYGEQMGLCVYCGREMGRAYTVDHKIPVSRRGTNYPSNLVLACRPCNTAKHDRTVEEFAEWRRARAQAM